MRTLVSSLVFFAAATATAAPLELGHDGARLLITVRGASGPAMPEARGDMIEIGLRAVAESARVDYDDATIKRLVLVAGARPRLVIAMHHGKRTTERLAAATRIEMIDGALRVTLPRESGAAEVAAPPPPVEAPRPIVEARPEAKLETRPEAKPETKPEAKPEPKIEAKSEAPKIEPAPAKIELPAPKSEPAPAEAEPLSPAAAASERPTPRATWLVLGAIACLPLAWLARKKKQGAAPAPSLRVLASQALGGKSRLVLVETEGRRILLAVNDANTRVVTQYDAATAPVEAAAPAPAMPAAALEAYAAATARDDEDAPEDDAAAEDARGFVAPMTRPTSPAVNGLLKLRNGDAAGPSEWGEALRRAARRARSS